MTRRKAILLFLGIGVPSVAYGLWCLQPFYLRAEMVRSGDRVPPDAESAIAKWYHGLACAKRRPLSIEGALRALADPMSARRKIQVNFGKVSEDRLCAMTPVSGGAYLGEGVCNFSREAHGWELSKDGKLSISFGSGPVWLPSRSGP